MHFILQPKSILHNNGFVGLVGIFNLCLDQHFQFFLKQDTDSRKDCNNNWYDYVWLN